MRERIPNEERYPGNGGFEKDRAEMFAVSHFLYHLRMKLDAQSGNYRFTLNRYFYEIKTTHIDNLAVIHKRRDLHAGGNFDKAVGITGKRQQSAGSNRLSHLGDTTHANYLMLPVMCHRHGTHQTRTMRFTSFSTYGLRE